MSGIQLPTYVEEFLERIIAKNDFSDCSKLIKSGSKAGDGISSQLISVEISDHRQNDKKLDLVCKIEPEDEFYRKELCTNIVFNREATIYNEILPLFMKFQIEKNIPKEHEFASWAQCFLAQAIDSESAIILEDLRPRGFKMWDKAKPSPIENTILVMRELGKFHGISFAIKDQRPNDFAKIKQLKDLLRPLCQTKSTISEFYATFDNAIQTIKNEDHKNILRDIKKNFFSHLEYCLNDEASDRFGVLCHGDFWNNNILYRSNQNGAVESVRFLDWQLARYASPATDLLYYLFTSTDKKLRDKEYVDLLKLYYESLSKTVRILGSNPDELFTFENLQTELKQCGNFALIMAPLVIQYSQTDSSEISNVHEACGQNSATHLKEEYARQINDLLEDIVKFEYYRKIGLFRS